MSSILHLDYETRSFCNLKTEGGYRYATDPTTEIVFMGWAFDDDPVELWKPLQDEPFPEEVANFMGVGGRASLHAHNAQFERLITQYVLNRDKPRTDLPAINHWYCTAAQARARAMPGGLDELGRFLNLKTQKDRRGKELIKLLSIPHVGEDGELIFREDPDLLEEFGEYCKTDVEVERDAEKFSPPLTEEEHWDWVLNEVINDRGLRIDKDFAQAATAYATEEKDEIGEQLSQLTDGEITTPNQHARNKKFMAPYMEEDDRIRKIMTVVKTDRRTGEEQRKITLDKDARYRLLAVDDEEPGFLTPQTRDVIELIDEAARSSVSKYRNMFWRANDEDRVQGAYIFCGAGQTGRYSSTGLQVHNFPRKCAKGEDIDRIRQLVIGRGPIDNVMDSLSSMLRPSIIAAPGHSFVCGDWSAIEARVLPWLADDPDADRVLDIFRTNDADPDLPDIYMVEYANAYGGDPADVDTTQRGVGKVIVLSLGYQGAVRALQAMARAYQVSVSDTEADRLKTEWRLNNPWAPKLWRDLENAAKDAVRYPGQLFPVGRVAYCQPDANGPLYCQLPSGRVLSYPFPRLEWKETKFGEREVLSIAKAAWSPKVGEEEWPRIDLYGGMLAENNTQATSNCIQRHAIRLCHEDGWPVVGHTHDELLNEVRDDEVAEAEPALKACMMELPAWAEGLPMAVETWNGKRYRK